MESDWVLDSLVGLLRSPTWRCRVEDFIDQNCLGKLKIVTLLLNTKNIYINFITIHLVFDSEEENPFSYTDVHQQYQNMVGVFYSA